MSAPNDDLQPFVLEIRGRLRPDTPALVSTKKLINGAATLLGPVESCEVRVGANKDAQASLRALQLKIDGDTIFSSYVRNGNGSLSERTERCAEWLRQLEKAGAREVDLDIDASDGEVSFTLSVAEALRLPDGWFGSGVGRFRGIAVVLAGDLVECGELEEELESDEAVIAAITERVRELSEPPTTRED